jgi:imidazolonepropionase-like amidohydrolase
MSRRIVAPWALVALPLAVAASQPAPTAGVRAAAPSALYEGARLIAGDGRPAIEQSALLVEGGRITRVGRKGELTPPAGAVRVPLDGTSVMPLLVSTHGHPGFQKGLTYTAENYTRETILGDLDRALYFGVGVVQSQGIEIGGVMDQIRADQAAGALGGARLLISGRGIGAPNAGPGGAAYRGIAYEITTETEAREAVQQLAAKKVDLIKIWVDDRNGRAPKLSAPLYRSVIEEGHKRGLRVNAHVFYHDDAVDLVNAGIDGFAHLVRDVEMSDALVAAIVARGVYVMGNLSSPQLGTYAALPAWLTASHPLFALVQASVPPEVVQRMLQSYSSRDEAAVKQSRTRYEILRRSLAKLSRAGARIILGADTGLQDHLFGLAEQRELSAMVDAGMTPAQAIVAATSRSAEFLKLNDVGTLAPGKRADFMVLDGNPLDDIANAGRIRAVILNGVTIDRDKVSASIK